MLYLLAAVALFLVGVVGFNLLTFAIAFARPPRPPRLLPALLFEIVAALALLPFWPLFALLGRHYRLTLEHRRSNGRPLILLHGYGMNRTNWLWLGRLLARRGIGPAYGVSYFSPFRLERSSARLARFVEEVATAERAIKVDIVAHSLGGLVARDYIERLGGAGRVRHLVTIATPHRGTFWGRHAVGPVRQVLRQRDPTWVVTPPDGVTYTSIWSRCDNLIVPSDSARLGDGGSPGLDGPADVIFDDLGHLGLLVSPRVADAVAVRLQRD